ncbi:hypothetical protein SAY87_012218 [Trapa incisa]|uniref:Uncharacterized protein n=1 Tax=Trapa incisa TaxID=236973 RepID=A0AAN7GKJ2_9MYRT|nr:hypothetical protein SAY87_012218 [Trapa incisa]
MGEQRNSTARISSIYSRIRTASTVEMAAPVAGILPSRRGGEPRKEDSSRGRKADANSFEADKDSVRKSSSGSALRKKAAGFVHAHGGGSQGDRTLREIPIEFLLH